MSLKAETQAVQIKRPSMFVDELCKKTPFYKVNAVQQKKSFFSLSMNNCFNKNTAKSDAILILRMLANQCLKAGNVNDFLGHINREINIKNGRFEAEIMARDALINKFI